MERGLAISLTNDDFRFLWNPIGSLTQVKK